MCKGVPDSLNQWDRDETTRQAVEACENILLQGMTIDDVAIRPVVLHNGNGTCPKAEWFSPDAVYGLKTRLFSVGRKKKAVKPLKPGTKKLSNQKASNRKQP